MPNYKDIEGLLATHTPFKHAHSMRAEGNVATGGDYRVYSYSTLIATYINGEWSLNENKYSVTTSKQQNILRRVIARATN